MKIAFQIDDPIYLNIVTDSSIFIASAMKKCGHNVEYYTPKTMFYDKNTIFVESISIEIDPNTKRYRVFPLEKKKRYKRIQYGFY